LTLHKLDKAQHPNLIIYSSYAFSTIDIKLVSPPNLIILLRWIEESLEMLPIANIAFSIIYFLFDLSKHTNRGIPPFSITV